MFPSPKGGGPIEGQNGPSPTALFLFSIVRAPLKALNIDRCAEVTLGFHRRKAVAPLKDPPHGPGGVCRLEGFHRRKAVAPLKAVVPRL